MFSSYYDTSGAQRGGPFIVTAGILGSEKQWLRLEVAWRAALKDAGIPHLHMRTLPQFFKDHDDEKQAFLSRLVLILRRYSAKTFVVTLDVEEYEKLNEQYLLDEARGPAFPLCAAYCAAQARAWHRVHHPRQPLRHYHEYGDVDKGKLINLCETNGIEMEFPKKRNRQTGEWFVPFQANDFLAWESRRGYSDAVNQSPHDFRPSFVKLVQTLKTERLHLDRDRLRMLCENAIPRRSSARAAIGGKAARLTRSN
jgi:hypothetical protein